MICQLTHSGGVDRCDFRNEQTFTPLTHTHTLTHILAAQPLSLQFHLINNNTDVLTLQPFPTFGLWLLPWEVSSDYCDVVIADDTAYESVCLFPFC